ncbi:MAG: M67 family metallopeptidase [Desulfobulbaceae bacterium]
MITVRIATSVLQAISEHALREHPIEACGYLAAQDGVIVAHYELTNVDGSPEHFTMDHREQFAAVRDMRGRGLRLAAVYHSHPETPARPSAEDIRLAYDPDISYVIVSLANMRKKPDIRSFRITKGVVHPEEIETVEHASAAGSVDSNP